MKPTHRSELHARIKSFQYAFAGIAYMLKHEHNAWIHSIATVCVIAVGIWLDVSRIEWVMLVLAMMAVWMGELFNTAVEAIVDMTSPDPHPLAKVAKDVAAGATLVAAIGAAIVGFLIFLPPLLARLGG